MSTTTGAARPINRLRAIDWTGQKHITLAGRLDGDVTVGEVAEEFRERMRLPRGNYAVYFDNRKLNRAATLDDEGLAEDAELEISPEVKAGRR